MRSTRSRIPDTRWSLIERAALHDRVAVGSFIAAYEPVLLTYLVHICRFSEENARETLQAFFVDRILDGKLLEKADRHRGRLRSLLFTALKNYLADRRRHEKAGIRESEGGPPIPLDGMEEKLGAEAGPDVFDRLWARQIIRLALQEARAETESAGQARYWSLFEARFLLPILHGHDPEPYGECAKRLSFRTPREASNALITIKRRVRRAMERVVSTYARAENVDDELNALCRIVETSEHLLEGA
jgi:hypothetical protein